ncbi:MAG TPA: patatin-like phospholipase family protein [Stellaceae bacterium]|nr:patatin-like phospholipase family protein [Stellaceae bacterium]
MTTIAPPPPPTGDEREQMFPVSRDPPAPKLFELGLVLGGTVSAGAYTAGALDCLLEMLENWYDTNPEHQVVVRLAAGASGGAICAGMLGLLSRKKVPHITGTFTDLIASDAPTGNPFWDVWVNLVDGKQFLTSTDIGDGPLLSVLNAALIDQIATDLANFAQVSGNFARPYFPAPFRLAVTLANLRGIPYMLDVPGFERWSGGSYVAHDDVARFAVANGIDPNTPLLDGGKRLDEFWVDPAIAGRDSDYVDYRTLVSYAVASAAFPAGLEARLLERPARHYAYRPYVRPESSGAAVELPQPDWQIILADGDTYQFASVDGGTFNNDPVSLVHQALAGMAGENPRAPEKACRALFMIDPLAAKPREAKAPATDLFSVIGTLVGAVTEGARYLTADMALIADPDVFSRYQLVPARRDLAKLGSAALATDWLDAFGGFFCRDFRVHDFLLGRLNLRNYLRTTMILRGDNPLFDGWSAANRSRWAVDADGNRVAVTPAAAPSSYFLPIIPDTAYDGTGPIAVEPDAGSLPWPWKALDPADLRDPVRTRVDALLTKLRKQALPGFGGWLLGGVLAPRLASTIADRVIDMFRDGLADQGLWPKQS